MFRPLATISLRSRESNNSLAFVLCDIDKQCRPDLTDDGPILNAGLVVL